MKKYQYKDGYGGWHTTTHTGVSSFGNFDQLMHNHPVLKKCGECLNPVLFGSLCGGDQFMMTPDGMLFRVVEEPEMYEYTVTYTLKTPTPPSLILATSPNNEAMRKRLEAAYNDWSVIYGDLPGTTPEIKRIVSDFKIVRKGT